MVIDHVSVGVLMSQGNGWRELLSLKQLLSTPFQGRKRIESSKLLFSRDTLVSPGFPGKTEYVQWVWQMVYLKCRSISCVLFLWPITSIACILSDSLWWELLGRAEGGWKEEVEMGSCASSSHTASSTISLTKAASIQFWSSILLRHFSEEEGTFCQSYQ